MVIHPGATAHLALPAICLCCSTLGCGWASSNFTGTDRTRVSRNSDGNGCSDPVARGMPKQLNWQPYDATPGILYAVLIANNTDLCTLLLLSAHRSLIYALTNPQRKHTQRGPTAFYSTCTLQILLFTKHLPWGTPPLPGASHAESIVRAACELLSQGRFALFQVRR